MAGAYTSQVVKSFYGHICTLSDWTTLRSRNHKWQTCRLAFLFVVIDSRTSIVSCRSEIVSCIGDGCSCFAISVLRFGGMAAVIKKRPISKKGVTRLVSSNHLARKLKQVNCAQVNSIIDWMIAVSLPGNVHGFELWCFVCVMFIFCEIIDFIVLTMSWNLNGLSGRHYRPCLTSPQVILDLLV